MRSEPRTAPSAPLTGHGTVRAAVLALLLLALMAAPAGAAEVLVAAPGGARAVDDPYLPADEPARRPSARATRRAPGRQARARP